MRRRAGLLLRILPALRAPYKFAWSKTTRNRKRLAATLASFCFPPILWRSPIRVVYKRQVLTARTNQARPRTARSTRQDIGTAMGSGAAMQCDSHKLTAAAAWKSRTAAPQHCRVTRSLRDTAGTDSLPRTLAISTTKLSSRLPQLG